MDERLHDESIGTDEDPGWPVGFLVMVGLAALYLVIRFVQLGLRFVDWLF